MILDNILTSAIIPRSRPTLVRRSTHKVDLNRTVIGLDCTLFNRAPEFAYLSVGQAATKARFIVFEQLKLADGL